MEGNTLQCTEPQVFHVRISRAIVCCKSCAGWNGMFSVQEFSQGSTIGHDNRTVINTHIKCLYALGDLVREGVMSVTKDESCLCVMALRPREHSS